MVVVDVQQNATCK